MKKYETQIDLNDFPPELHRYLTAGKIYDSSCSPEAKTLYCEAGYYIKIAPKGELSREAEMGKRFHRLGLGVEVMAYVADEKDYLVTRSADGEDLTHFLDDPEMLCHVMADALRNLHSRNIGDAPVSVKLRDYQNCSGFNDYLRMDCIGIHTREDALEILQRNSDRLKTDTLIHGDACLPNIISRDGRFSAFIDCGLGGAGDRHIDLFWAIWSLKFNLKTEAYTDRFLELYGLDRVDFEMLRNVAAFELLGGE